MRLSSLPLFRFRSWCFGTSRGFVGEGLSSLTHAETRLRLTLAVSFISLFLFLFFTSAFFSAALTLRYRNAVCLIDLGWNPDLQFATVSLQKCHFTEL